MSYAGPTRTRGSARSASAFAAPTSRPSRPRRSAFSPVLEPAGDTDWRQVAIFGAGVAIGIAVGAGAALLAAPSSGAETRAVLRAKVGRVQRSATRRGRDAWDDLRDEIGRVERAMQRRALRRTAQRDLRRELEHEATLD